VVSNRRGLGMGGGGGKEMGKQHSMQNTIFHTLTHTPPKQVREKCDGFDRRWSEGGFKNDGTNASKAKYRGTKCHQGSVLPSYNPLGILEPVQTM
jgi:hypothetical protein